MLINSRYRAGENFFGGRYIMTRQSRLFCSLMIAGSISLAFDAQAGVGSAVAPNVVALGSFVSPTSTTYGDSFSAPTSSSFYDDYTFSFTPASSLTDITASLNLGAIFGISNISARLYEGTGPYTSVSNPLEESWSTPVTYGLGLTGSTTVISLGVVPADTYTLEIRGDVTGVAGGSYSGIMNLAPVPEPKPYGMLILGLGLIGVVARKSSKSNSVNKTKFIV